MSDRYHQPDHPNSVGWVHPQTITLASEAEPFTLDTGATLGPIQVEYETYGTLNTAKDNVILITHALSGDAHVAGWDADAETSGRQWRTRKPGWWDAVIGPGKPIDTDRHYVICSNVLGSCYGTTGPSAINPQTGKAYGTDFPIVMVSDWVRVQARLLDHLGIDRLYAVIGGSLGGQQALEWTLAYPERVERCVILAASDRLSAQGLAFNAVGRYSIMNDPGFQGGHYYEGDGPQNGLAAARMLAHITYLSDEGMHEKFGRRLQGKEKPDFGFGVEFQVESYLDYQGRSFVERFDANSYLYITRAMDYYEPAARWGGGKLEEACARIRSRMMILSFSTDWLYPPEDCHQLALAIRRTGQPVTYVDVPSRYGHDAFLVEEERVGKLLAGFLAQRPKGETA
ncbi:MAG: homoserine O-acetyltransferase MetX [Planctomycetota bacterium]|jgi:homoserine O-acetyltransferase